MKNNLYRFLNNPAFDALQKLHEQFDNSALFSTMNELQRTLDMVKVPTSGITAALQTYQDSIAPLMSTVQNINNLYAPILEQTKKYEGVYNSSMVAVLQSSAAAMKSMAGLDFSAIENIANSLPKYDFLSESILRNIDFDDIVELYENGEITDDDIAGEFSDMVTQKDFSFVESWDKVKKAKWFLALRCLFIILTFLGKPAIDKVADNTLEALGVNEFWAESGIYEWLDDIFGVESCHGTVTEQEAKETVKEENIGNVSKQKRDDLISKIKEIRTYISAAQQDENTGNLLTYLSELEKDVNGKKYGLIFEEHREEIDEVLATHTPVLSEEKDLMIDNGGNMNFLVEGDNLASLKLLEKTHRNRIQTIYIDPPYNTGNKDFTYDDSKVDSLDGFRHSKWLSFMEARLKIAKRLLSSQGIIFLSIDDNEMTSLKALCDSIFGEQNFVANVIVKSNPRGSQSTKEIASVHEYVLVYAKDISSSAIIGHKLTDNMQSEYNLSDEKGAYRLLGLRQRGGFWRASERPKLFYPFYVNPNNANISLFEDSEHVIAVYPYQPTTGEKGTWRWSKEKVEKDGQVLIAKTVKRGAEFVWDIYQKDYMASEKGIRRTKAKSLWDEKEMNYQNAANELKELFETSPFTYAKPTYLVQRAIEMIDYSQSPFILDFFAGSGTTGHAVMKMNAEDGGNRRFILCTNNENNICRDVTYERIKRVIDKENYTASLKYFKVEYVPISKRMYYEYADELLKHIRELVELENGVNFNDNAEIAIALTQEELDDFVSSLGKDSRCCKLYMGHDLLPSGEQENILAAQGIKINIIPDYYYRDLQEG